MVRDASRHSRKIYGQAQEGRRRYSPPEIIGTFEADDPDPDPFNALEATVRASIQSLCLDPIQALGPPGGGPKVPLHLEFPVDVVDPHGPQPTSA